MSWLNKPTPTIDKREQWIQLGRELTTEQYKKGLKILDIYREADEASLIVDLGSKKALREKQADDNFAEEVNTNAQGLGDSL
jgi:hypothetical protein